jgi:hypothetical protein
MMKRKYDTMSVGFKIEGKADNISSGRGGCNLTVHERKAWFDERRTRVQR